jgi:hypothetical protein
MRLEDIEHLMFSHVRPLMRISNTQKTKLCLDGTLCRRPMPCIFFVRFSAFQRPLYWNVSHLWFGKTAGGSSRTDTFTQLCTNNTGKCIYFYILTIEREVIDKIRQACCRTWLLIGRVVICHFCCAWLASIIMQYVARLSHKPSCLFLTLDKPYVK